MDVITTHISADFDALASMIAARKLYPDAVLAFPGAQEKSIRDFLLQSTAYLLDIRKARSIDIDSIDRLVLVDIRQKSRIGPFAPLVDRDGVEIHIYDHHPPAPDDIRGSVEVIRPCGSTTAILCGILQERGLDISPDEATVMMLGIYEDTGNLTFSSTTPEDYQAAAYLLSQGASLNIVADMVIKELTPEQVALLNDLIENSCTQSVHGVDILVTKSTSSTYVGDFAVLVHKLKNMSNVNALVALARMDDSIYVVVRSRIEEVNAGEIAALFGGGGHATAASATVHDMTLVQAEQRLLDALPGIVHPIRVARDFMTAPVKCLDVRKTLADASAMLTRYNINALPVVQGRALVGIITRQIIDRARHHGLAAQSVSEYMVSEFATVRGNTPLEEITRIISAGNQRFLPVVSGQTIQGAITRTDLLRVLHVDTASGDGAVQDRSRGARHKTMKTMLVERLSRPALTLLRDIGHEADLIGVNVYAVGGFVRDILMHNDNFDIDIVVEGDGIAFARAFARRTGCQVKAHPKFGTAVMYVDDRVKIDVASARLEYYEHPAALPKVEWSSIKLDLYRRDFSINTLAIRLNSGRFGELIDFFSARRDIKEKTIRVLHNLSFVEDPSRIFRAIRFEQRFGFQLGKLTRGLIDNAVRNDFPAHMSGKRICSELVLLLQEEQVLPVLKRLQDFDLLRYVHPSLTCDAALRTIVKDIAGVLNWFDLLYLDCEYEHWFVYFLGLIDRLDDRQAEVLVRRFDLKKKYAVPIAIAKKEGPVVLRELAHSRGSTNADIYTLIHHLPVPVSLFLMARSKRQIVKKAFSRYFTSLRTRHVHLRGRDLLDLGVPPGRIYRRLLDRLQDAVLNDMVSGREAEKQFVRNIMREEGM